MAISVAVDAEDIYKLLVTLKRARETMVLAQIPGLDQHTEAIDKHIAVVEESIARYEKIPIYCRWCMGILSAEHYRETGVWVHQWGRYRNCDFFLGSLSTVADPVDLRNNLFLKAIESRGEAATGGE